MADCDQCYGGMVNLLCYKDVRNFLRARWVQKYVNIKISLCTIGGYESGILS